ncbi:MAG: DUF1592 domain-containing protein, partial [Pirellulaceae bacterium]
CVECHSADSPDGDVLLHELQSAEQVLEQRVTWEKALRLLAIDAMPPKDYDTRPTRAQREALMEWLDLKLYHVDCRVVDDPGQVTIHRLNRTEYRNTVRDLLGVDVDPTADFPSDDVGYGFSNIADVLSLPPLLMEKYVDAAERIAQAAIQAGDRAARAADDELPESHRRIIFTRPSAEQPVGGAARAILDRLLPRAFRRPVDPLETERLVRLVELAVQRGDTFERGVQVALQAILVSPHFLFRVEEPADAGDAIRGESTEQHTGSRPIGPFELASRLSYFLWSTMPDDELLRLASENQLRRPEVLDAQVTRMLQDPRADALVDNFASQWLTLSNMVEAAPDARLFPEFTPELRHDMVAETKAFVRAVFREDRSLLDFLDADFTFVNEQLARHYGMEGVRGAELQRVALPAEQRAGVLTHGSILTITSNPDRTSLVRRGAWILDNILGAQLPDPPANVPSLEEGARKSGATSLRDQLKIHRESPSCAACHDTLDPIGFGFENFDPIGRWRTQSEGQPVDAGGTLPTGESFRGPTELVQILKARKDDFVELLTRKMLTYALGRGLQIPDSCTVDSVVDQLRDHDYRFTVLVRGIVHSKPFLMTRAAH